MHLWRQSNLDFTGLQYQKFELKTSLPEDTEDTKKLDIS